MTTRQGRWVGPQPRTEHVELAASGAALGRGDRACARPRAWRRRGKCASLAWHLDGHSRVPLASRLPSAKLATWTDGPSELAAPGRGGGRAGRCSCRGRGARKDLPEESARGWATHRRRAQQRNRQTRARVHWERSGEVAQVLCTPRLALSLPGLMLGRERKSHAAVRHLMKRASRLRRRGPKIALTTTGSWWPRLRRRGGGACLMRNCDKERAAHASFEFEN